MKITITISEEDYSTIKNYPDSITNIPAHQRIIEAVKTGEVQIQEANK